MFSFTGIRMRRQNAFPLDGYGQQDAIHERGFGAENLAASPVRWNGREVDIERVVFDSDSASAPAKVGESIARATIPAVDSLNPSAPLAQTTPINR